MAYKEGLQGATCLVQEAVSKETLGRRGEQLGRVNIQRGKSGSPSREHEDKMGESDHLGGLDLLFQHSPKEMASH